MSPQIKLFALISLLVFSCRKDCKTGECSGFTKDELATLPYKVGDTLNFREKDNTIFKAWVTDSVHTQRYIADQPGGIGLSCSDKYCFEEKEVKLLSYGKSYTWHISPSIYKQKGEFGFKVLTDDFDERPIECSPFYINNGKMLIEDGLISLLCKGCDTSYIISKSKGLILYKNTIYNRRYERIL